MRKIFFLFILITNFAHSQSAKIIYSINVDGSEIISTDKEIQDRFNNMTKLANEIKLELLISKQQSSFICKDNIDVDTDSENDFEKKSAKMAFVSGSDVFVDLSKNTIIHKESDGQITTSILPKYDWKLLDETKNIDDITCYKATLTLNLIGRKGNPITQIIEAWYAPSIPYSFGPKEYNGLPGLILELRDKRTTYIASKIELLSNEIELNIPKGKMIDRTEYLKKIKSNLGM